MMTEQTKSLGKKNVFADLLETAMGKLKAPIEVEEVVTHTYDHKIIHNALLARMEYKNAVLNYESVSNHLTFDNGTEEELIQTSYENMKRAEQVMGLHMQIIRVHGARWDWSQGTDAIRSSSFNEII